METPGWHDYARPDYLSYLATLDATLELYVNKQWHTVATVLWDDTESVFSFRFTDGTKLTRHWQSGGIRYRLTPKD